MKRLDGKKALVSFVAGLISFYVNLNPIAYPLENGQYTTLNIGVWVPLLLSIAWGWEYGLISSVLGLSTMYGFIAWAPSGWGGAIGSFTFTLWVFLHGYLNKYNTQDSSTFRYASEIIIRVFFVIFYYIVFPWSYQFNPPFWAPMATTNPPSAEFMRSIMTKQSLEGIFWVAFCDMILKSYYGRKILGLRTEEKEIYTTSIIAQYALIGIGIICIDILLEFLAGDALPFLEELLFNPDRTEAKYRLLILIVLSGAGVLHSNNLRNNRLLESKLRRTNKLEAIGTLAGGVAHDFNNILVPIRGYTELMHINTETPEDKDQLRIILESVDRAKELIKQILNYAQPVMQTNHQQINIRNAVDEVILLLRSSIPRSIKLQVNIMDGDYHVLANPNQIHQVIMNLCTNAYQAIPQDTDGVVDIIVKPITLEHAYHDVPSGKYIHLSVHDNGCGISPDIHDKIFDPYFSTKDKSQSLAGSGTGLGLSTVYGILKEIGGYIDFNSEVNKGTVFNVYLPIVQTMDTVEILEEEYDDIVMGNGQHILVVDDDKTITKYLDTLLQKMNYKTSCFNDSKEALKSFTSHPEQYHALITDLTMPDIDGLELSRKLTQIKPDLPIILCTGYSIAGSLEKSRMVGVNKFYMKPVSTYDISQSLHELLQEH